MADAVGSVRKIVEVALMIKDAVDTVRQNRKDCHHIRNRVERVRRTLSLCESNAELMESPAVSAAVEELGEVLDEALELVTDCQEETTAANAVCLCWKAGKLSKQLSKADKGISNVNLDATLAICAYLISKQTQHGARPAPPPEMSEQTLKSAHSPQQTQDGARLPTPPEPEGSYFVDRPAKMPRWEEDFVYCCASPMEVKHRPRKDTISFFGGDANMDSWEEEGFMYRKMASSEEEGESFIGEHADMASSEEEINLLLQIARVAFNIKAAVETVRRNKEDYAEIGRRANRISGLLSQLKDTETLEDAAVTGALEKLLETFRHAHTAVTACRRRSIVAVVCHCCSPGKLSDELRGVLDQMVLDLDGLIEKLPIARD